MLSERVVVHAIGDDVRHKFRGETKVLKLFSYSCGESELKTDTHRHLPLFSLMLNMRSRVTTLYITYYIDYNNTYVYTTRDSIQ